MLDSPLPLKEYSLRSLIAAVAEVKAGGSIDTVSVAAFDSCSPPDTSEGHRQRHPSQHASITASPSSPPSAASSCATSRSSSSGSIHDEMMRTLTKEDDLALASCSLPSRYLSRNLFTASHLMPAISEILLTSLAAEGRLTDQLLASIFHPDNCRIEQVRIPDAQHLTRRGLRVLRGHRIRHLEVVGLKKATINELIGCLGDYTLNNISYFSVSRSCFTSSARFCVVISLSKLRNLRHLDVSHTDISHHGLEIIVEDLPNLQSLDISATRVKDLNPLRKCKHRLRSLAMYNLRSPNPVTGSANRPEDSFLTPLLDLNQLVKLDISDDRDSPVDVLTRGSNSVSCILKKPENFPLLKYLDISGRDGIDLDDLKRFVSFKHRLGPDSCLTFLGLMQTDICTNDVFTCDRNGSYPEYTGLIVTGFATQDQILNSLRVYADRPSYIQKSLCFLYNYTINELSEPRVDLIDIIVPLMKKHSKMIGIQMAATACLYNLTKGKIADKIHPKWLGRVVGATLDAMESFPNHQQLQKNTLLTLCSDRILQEVTFDRFKCTKLVMESLVNFRDLSMNRMAVAICSILAAKISTDETSTLGAKPIYMETLLTVIRSRVHGGQGQTDGGVDAEPDIMLKFTLSALWNLTDESPLTCAMFIDKGGVDLYLEVLAAFRSQPSVEMKVLGLLNNIAEVPDLRKRLMTSPFLNRLRELLVSPSLDVSYFAAGIFAHLMSEESLWTNNLDVSRDEVAAELSTVVLNWKTPENEMVAYRSFNPFLPLLRCESCSEVQLWAVWAIHHVCSKNPNRYCEMLLQPHTLYLFNCVVESARIRQHLPLLQLCAQTLEVLRQSFPHASRNLNW